MPLHYRKRGETWHVRGTVRVGRQTLAVPEHSTGARSRADAEAIGAAEEARIRAEHIDGPAGRAKRIAISECFADYLGRPGGVERYDVDRVRDLNLRLGHRMIADAPEAWADWLRTRGSGMAPATAARTRAILVAALRAGCGARAIDPPKVPAVSQPDDVRVRYLSFEEQEALLGAYNPHAARPVLVMCYQGLRSQEALQIQRSDINFQLNTLFVRKSKNGQARTLKMHPRVRAMLERLDLERPSGALFLSAKGAPYSDTRGEGGNPLSQAHATACRKAGVDDFRPHDWRHHWASWQVMNGTDLVTLQRMGGWKDHRSVLRYAAVSTDHMAEAIARMR